MSAGAPLLEVSDLEKRFSVPRSLRELARARQASSVQALDGVSLTVARHETLGIVGESGSGKSTLARCIVRLYEPDAGSVRFDGIDVLRADRRTLRAVRRRVQLVYQDPYTSLNPRLSIRDAVAEPARVHGLTTRAGEAAYVDSLLERVGLSRADGTRRPRELSGGQRQRAAIARALGVQPDVLIADEPVSALDVSIQAQILNVFQQLSRDLGVAMIFISHQLSVVAHLSQRVAIMYLGRIVETGPTRVVFRDPRHPYTAALIATHPTIDSRRRGAPVLRGEIPTTVELTSGCRFRPRCRFAEPVCEQVDPPGVEPADGRVSFCHFARERLQTSSSPRSR
jgi:oligopeptide transport system ATP-binding protein